MKIAILGTGMVGNAIATKLVKVGHQIMMGSRTASSAGAGMASQRRRQGALPRHVHDGAVIGPSIFNHNTKAKGKNMNITIIGAGRVGGTLGERFATAGHKVTFAVRNPADEKIQTLLREIGPQASAKLVADCADCAEVVLLATPWDGTQEAIRTAGNLAGKILVDAVNPLALTPEGLQRGLLVGHTASAAEHVADWAASASCANERPSMKALIVHAHHEPKVFAGRCFGSRRRRCGGSAMPSKFPISARGSVGRRPT
jgi:predicted dinucleotide-binding enzyme